MRIVLHRQKPALGIRHLAEIVLDELCKVSRRLNFVQGTKSGGFAAAAAAGVVLRASPRVEVTPAVVEE